jgi:hypothetical protein
MVLTVPSPLLRPAFARRCNKLEPLESFDGAKRSCATRLAAHNMTRRRKSEAAASAAAAAAKATVAAKAAAAAAALAAAPAGDVPGLSGGGVSAGSSSGSGGGASAAPAEVLFADELPEADALQAALSDGLFDLADFMYDELFSPPPDPAAARAAAAASAAAAEQAAAVASAAAAAASAPAAAAFAAAAAAMGLRPETLHVKLSDTPPWALPPGLRCAIMGVFSSSAVHELTTCLRPGCTLLTVDALLADTDAEGEGAPLLGAAEALTRLRRSAGTAGACFAAAARRRGALAVRARGEEARSDADEGSAVTAFVGVAPRLPPLAPLALLSTAPATLRTATAAALLPPGALHGCRLHGRVLTPLLTTTTSTSDGAAATSAAMTQLRLAPCGEEGALLLEALPPGLPLHAAAPPRAVLLCADARIVAEVTAAGAALAAQHGDDAAWAHAEVVVMALGAALRPRAPRRVVAAAAVAALHMGWHATLARLLPALLGTDDDTDADAAVAADADAAAAAHFLALTCHAPRAGLCALVAAAPRRAAGAALAGALLSEARHSSFGSDASRHRPVDAAREALLRRAPATTPPRVAAAAAAMLDAVSAELEQRSRNKDDAAADADASPSAAAAPPAAAEDDEAAYVRYLARLNAPLWRLLAALIVIQSLIQLRGIRRFVLPQPNSDAFRDTHTSASWRHMMAVTRLHAPPSPTAPPPIGIADVPWMDVIAAARIVSVGLLLIRIPAGVLQAVLTAPTRLPRRLGAAVDAHYDAIFGVLTTLDAATLFLLPDAAAFSVTGRAVEWPAATLALRGLALLTLAQRCGPLRVRANLVTLVLRVACAFAVLLYARAWRVLLGNVGYLAFAACAAASAARAPARDARMRAAHAEERAVEARAALDARRGKVGK